MARCSCCGKNTVPDYAADHLGVDECTSCSLADMTPAELQAQEEREEAEWYTNHPELDADLDTD